MKKGLKGLLVALVAVGSVTASDSHNKTHLNVRIARDTTPAYTTFHEMKHVIRKDGGFGLGGRGNLEITGFYGRSANGEHVARNFYPHCQEKINVKAALTSNDISLGNILTNSPSVHNHWLLHDLTANNLSGDIRFDPKQTVYGARLDYFQRFDKWLEGLFVHVVIPFVHVDNDINMQVSNAKQHIETPADSNSVSLGDLFTGKDISRTVAGDKHAPLKYAKLCNNSKTGFGDVVAKVGWRFLEDERDMYHAAIFAGVVFPTGSKPNAEYLWGARTGQSKWGLLVGVDGSAALWEEGDQNLKIVASAEYRYLFCDHERRTLGLKELRFYDDVANIPETLIDPTFSQYYLVGKKGVAGLEPLANVSTLCVDVEPGSQFDGTLAFAYNNDNFVLDIGYNVFWKEAERLPEYKKNLCCPTSDICKSSGACAPCDGCPNIWTEDTYAVANAGYASTAEFGDANTASFKTAVVGSGKRGYIKKIDLAAKNAESAAQLVHKVFVAIGYEERSWEYPVMIGAGVAYEIAANNRDALEGPSFWFKAGVAF